MNEAGQDVIEIIKNMQKAKLINSLITFSAGGIFSIAAFVLGRLTSGG